MRYNHRTVELIVVLTIFLMGELKNAILAGSASMQGLLDNWTLVYTNMKV